MSESSLPEEAVPWHELPHNPMGFFGLQAGFEQKDLKRAYNRLLRKYKPENSPAEFQRIRAAYERLDNQLRYGSGHTAASLPSSVDWSQAVTIRTDLKGPPRNEESASKSLPSESSKQQPQDILSALMDEVRNSSPEAVSVRLQGKTQKSAYDYYVLAILSDTLPGRSTDAFVSQLLAGLVEFPKDTGLRGLLYTLFRQPLNPLEIPRILLRTSKVVRNDGFYSLTEPLWDILVRACPFDKVGELIKKCEAELRDFRVEAKLAFSLHMLRISLFRADHYWIQRTFEFLEENHSSLNSINEYELDRLQIAWTYLQQRDSRPPKNEIQVRMMKAIEQYFSDPEETRSNGIYDCQVHIATSIEDVTKSFPFDVNDKHLSPFLQLWYAVSSELEFRARILNASPEQTDRKIVWFLTKLQAQTDQSRLGKMWDLMSALIHFYAISFIASLVGGAITFFFVRNLSDSGISSLCTVVGAITTGILFQYGVLKPYWGLYCERMAIKCYNSLWRREVLQFLGQSQISFNQFFSRARALRDPKMDHVTWTLTFVGIDDAIPLYSTAQSFLK